MQHSSARLRGATAQLLHPLAFGDLSEKRINHTFAQYYELIGIRASTSVGSCMPNDLLNFMPKRDIAKIIM